MYKFTAFFTDSSEYVFTLPNGTTMDEARRHIGIECPGKRLSLLTQAWSPEPPVRARPSESVSSTGLQQICD